MCVSLCVFECERVCLLCRYAAQTYDAIALLSKAMSSLLSSSVTGAVRASWTPSDVGPLLMASMRATSITGVGGVISFTTGSNDNASPYYDMYNIPGLDFVLVATVVFADVSTAATSASSKATALTAPELYATRFPTNSTNVTASNSSAIALNGLYQSSGKTIVWPGYANTAPTFAAYTVALVYQSSNSKYVQALAVIKLSLDDINRNNFLGGGDVLLLPASRIYDDAGSATRVTSMLTGMLASAQLPVAVLGPFASGVGIATAAVLGAAGVPNVGCGATTPFLSDSESYPTFVRTVVSDTLGVVNVASVLLHYGWRQITVFYTNEIFGQGMLTMLQSVAQQVGIEIVFTAPFASGSTPAQLVPVWQTILERQLGVIVLLATEPNAAVVLDAVGGMRSNSNSTWTPYTLTFVLTRAFGLVHQRPNAAGRLRVQSVLDRHFVFAVLMSTNAPTSFLATAIGSTDQTSGSVASFSYDAAYVVANAIRVTKASTSTSTAQSSLAPLSMTVLRATSVTGVSGLVQFSGNDRSTSSFLWLVLESSNSSGSVASFLADPMSIGTTFEASTWDRVVGSSAASRGPLPARMGSGNVFAAPAWYESSLV
jgi:ABC-type branched-subunit amino acid transport system substrate-binding protein